MDAFARVSPMRVPSADGGDPTALTVDDSAPVTKLDAEEGTLRALLNERGTSRSKRSAADRELHDGAALLEKGPTSLRVAVEFDMTLRRAISMPPDGQRRIMAPLPLALSRRYCSKLTLVAAWPKGMGGRDARRSGCDATDCASDESCCLCSVPTKLEATDAPPNESPCRCSPPTMLEATDSPPAESPCRCKSLTMPDATARLPPESPCRWRLGPAGAACRHARTFAEAIDEADVRCPYDDTPRDC